MSYSRQFQIARVAKRNAHDPIFVQEVHGLSCRSLADDLNKHWEIWLMIQDLRCQGSPDSKSLYIKWWSCSLCATWQVASEALLESGRCWYNPTNMRQCESVRFGYTESRKCSFLRSKWGLSYHSRVDSKWGRASSTLGADRRGARSDVTEYSDMVEARLGECWDVWVEGENAVEGEAENLDLVENLDQRLGDIDSGGISKCSLGLSSI